jgi:hypothetical protein
MKIGQLSSPENQHQVVAKGFFRTPSFEFVLVEPIRFAHQPLGPVSVNSTLEFTLWRGKGDLNSLILTTLHWNEE